MCGRYLLRASPQDLQLRFDFSETNFPIRPRFNIAPTQEVLTVVQNDQRHAELMRWGLIPSWSKDPSIGNRMINARAETLPEKPAFRSAFKRQRCLVLADGFYEWRREAKGKTPMFIHLKDDEPFAMAGLWDVWQAPTGEPVHSCTIVTTEPNELIASIHNRMPAILLPEDEAIWLDPEVNDPAVLMGLLAPYPADALAVQPVSPLVNSPSNDSPACIAPAA